VRDNSGVERLKRVDLEVRPGEIVGVAGVDGNGQAELVAAILAVLTVVFGGYILLAVRARRLFTSARAIRVLNRGTGTVMAGAAAAIAFR